MAATYDDVIIALKQVIDPELGINIIDLGLVYEAQVLDDHILITMTMTPPPVHWVRTWWTKQPLQLNSLLRLPV